MISVSAKIKRRPQEQLGIPPEKADKTLEFLCSLDNYNSSFYSISILNDNGNRERIYGVAIAKVSAIFIMLADADGLLNSAYS